MIVFKTAWAVLKGVLYVTEALLDGVSSSGRAVARSDWPRVEEPPSRDRTSHFYSGPGSRKG